MTTDQFIRTKGSARGRERGFGVPAFIRNGSYYGTEIEVYEDGVVECWGLVDLDFFKQKMASGWISATVPNDQNLHYHELGAWRVTSGEWLMDKVSLQEKIMNLLRSLNPEMTGLVDFHGDDVEIINGTRYAKLGSSDGKPVLGSKPLNSDLHMADSDGPILGESIFAFITEGETFHLTPLRIYATGEIDIEWRCGAEKLVSDSELKALLSARKLTLRVPEGKWIDIDGLGRCKIEKATWFRKKGGDLFKEIDDIVAKLNGQATTIGKCKQAFSDYLANPSQETLAVLRTAYERVPEHHRRYCGDMDSKDIPIRMVLYGRKEIEMWSHRIVAEAQGEEALPDIDVPILNENAED